MTDEPNNPIDELSEPPSGDEPDLDVRDSSPSPESDAEQSAGDAADEPDVSADAETTGAADAEMTGEETVEPVAEPAIEPAAEAVADEPATKEKKKAAAGKTKAAPAEEAEPKSEKMDWYILKIQSNREESIREGLTRRVAIAGLEFYFGDIIVPTEKVTEFKGGKKRVMKRKLYPGYLVVHMEINDDTWFLVRETPGIGDFTGAAGHPTAMLPHEVARIVAKQEEKHDEAPKLKIAFNAGDQIKITEGTFENFEGEVHTIDETNGRVTVMINIFGRSTPVELEYWQIESV